MLITSNRSVGEWDTVFGDPPVATAILDRLLRHSQIITIPGGLAQAQGRCSVAIKAALQRLA